MFSPSDDVASILAFIATGIGLLVGIHAVFEPFMNQLRRLTYGLFAMAFAPVVIRFGLAPDVDFLPDSELVFNFLLIMGVGSIILGTIGSTRGLVEVFIRLRS